MSSPQNPKAMVKGLFNTVAPDYDRGPGCFAHFGRLLVEAAGITSGQRVLDIATGRGAALFPAEAAGAEVTGIDLADGMAEATNAEAVRRRLRTRVRVMDAETLEFPDASFDRVLCGFGVMFFPAQDRALQEMHRVLKPGGRLAVSTWQVSQSEELSRTLMSLGYGSGSPPGWITKSEVLQQLLERNGFFDVSVMSHSKDFQYAGIDEYWEQARGTVLRGTLDRLNPDERGRVRALFEERVKDRLDSDRLTLPATALIALGER